MDYWPQHFTAPNGTEMVVLRAEDWERLGTYAEDDARIADVRLARFDAGEETVPGEVGRAFPARRLAPLSRALAGGFGAEGRAEPGMVGRIETDGGYGSGETRRQLAAELERRFGCWRSEIGEELREQVRLMVILLAQNLMSHAIAPSKATPHNRPAQELCHCPPSVYQG